MIKKSKIADPVQDKIDVFEKLKKCDSYVLLTYEVSTMRCEVETNMDMKDAKNLLAKIAIS